MLSHSIWHMSLCTFVSSSSRKYHLKRLRPSEHPHSVSGHMLPHVAMTQVQGCSTNWPLTSEPGHWRRFSYLFRQLGAVQRAWHTFSFIPNQGTAHRFPFALTKNNSESRSGKSHLHDEWHLTFATCDCDYSCSLWHSLPPVDKKKHANLNHVHHFYTLQTLLAVKLHVTNPHH